MSRLFACFPTPTVSDHPVPRILSCTLPASCPLPAPTYLGQVRFFVGSGSLDASLVVALLELDGVNATPQFGAHAHDPHQGQDLTPQEDPDQRNDDTENGETEQEGKSAPWYVEIPIVVVMTLVIIMVLQTFVGRVYMIPSASMEPTLHGCSGCTGDRIFVDKISYALGEPKAGDVVVFKGTDSWNAGYVSQRSENSVIRGLQNLGSVVGLVAPDENDLVKRIVATGGQTVQCLEGDAGVTVDGKVIDSSYILDPPTYPVDPATGSEACGGFYFGPITVPEGNYFVMGDNRTNSADSRYHLGDEFQGTIPRENIRGKVQFILFPFNRIGGVDSIDIQG